MAEKKELLSPEEIKRIIEEATKPHFKDPALMVFARNRTDVIRVSPINQLIFIEGDMNTGFTHINQRHSQYHERPNWRKAKEEDGSMYWKLQKHSFFPTSVTPYFDYPKIVDSIYKDENLCIKKNTNPENYDLYYGNYKSQKDDIIPYKLLLYKGTKIVHNLYPDTDIFTPKRVLNYKKGTLAASYNVKLCQAEIQIPYYDRNKSKRYKILFLQDYFKKKEKVLIERLNGNNTSELFFITERDLLYEKFDSLRLDQMDFSEFPALERIILSIEKIP